MSTKTKRKAPTYRLISSIDKPLYEWGISQGLWDTETFCRIRDELRRRHKEVNKENVMRKLPNKPQIPQEQYRVVGYYNPLYDERTTVRAHFNNRGQLKGWSYNINPGLYLLVFIILPLSPYIFWLGGWAMIITKSKEPGDWAFKIFSFPAFIFCIYYTASIVDVIFGTNWYNSLPQIF